MKTLGISQNSSASINPCLTDSGESQPATLLTDHIFSISFFTSLNSTILQCADQYLKHISRYEFTLVNVFVWVPFFAWKTILQTFYHANIDYVRNWQSFIQACGIGAMIYSTVNVGCNYLLINNFGFFPPIPFGTYVIGTLTVPVMYATLWFRMPKSARTEKEIKKRFSIFLVSQAYDILVAWVYVCFTLSFILIPDEYQPILGFVCPLIREINQKILSSLAYRAAGGKNLRYVKLGKFSIIRLGFKAA